MRFPEKNKRNPENQSNSQECPREVSWQSRRVQLQDHSYLQSQKIQNRNKAVMTSECDSAAEIDVILSLLQVTRENEAICYRKGRFTELIVHFLEMRCKYQVWERCPTVPLGNEQWPMVTKHGEVLRGNQGQGKKQKRDGDLF